MPDRNQTSNAGSPKQPRPSPLTDEHSPLTDEQQGEKHGTRRQKQVQPDQNQDQEDTERVEIGDPVPEDDRTVRARGQGETGEDEDLPTDDGNIERGPRH